jgi:hypothetical protein
MRARHAVWAVVVMMGLAACGGGSDTKTVSVGIAPKNPNLQVGTALQFVASVGGTADKTVTWSATGCGSISPTGLFTAPATPGTCTVVATSHADPTKSAEATVTVTTISVSAWRPFSADSPWNTPIPPNPELQSDSAQLVQAFRTSSPQWPFISINVSGYSIPLYWADADTTSYPMSVDYGGQGWGGSNTTASMPIPAGAEPDPQSDHHMLVISADRKTEYGCWNVSHSGSSWHAGVCATSDLTGTGVRPAAGQPGVQYPQAAGSRACGFPLVAGLIRVEEIQAGHIDHALVIAYPGILDHGFIPPASTPSNGSGADYGVPCGGRFQYDPSVDVETLPISKTGKIIMKALQEYGAYVGDYSGALSLTAENSPEAQAYWATDALSESEFVDNYVSKIDMTKFRVIAYGQTPFEVH